MLRSAVFVARADLGNLLRQRETLLWVFVMPVVFFFFIGTVTSRFGTGPVEPEPLGMRVPDNAGFLVDELARKLEAQGFNVVRSTRDVGMTKTRWITFPAAYTGKTFTDAVLAGERQKLLFETSSEGPNAEFERLRVARAVYGIVADLAVMKSRNEMPTPSALAQLATMPRSVRLEVESAGARREPPSGFAQVIPGTTVMFTMLVLLTSGAILLIVERRQGLLRRLASTPMSRGSIVAGKWAGRLALGLVQLGVALAVGTYLFGMDWHGRLPMVGLVLVAWAGFNASLALLLGSLARSEAQMAGIGVISTMLLAALGGCWWPIEIAPRWMQRLALFLPTGWAMDALHRLVSFGDTAGAALPHVAALSIGGLAVGWLATRTFRFQ